MFTLNCNGKLLLIDKPLVMGVINLTEDSFFEGSRFINPDSIKNEVVQMINEGADIIDLGAQSTRPGSKRISPNEELGKLLPAIEILTKTIPEIIISIDTYHSKVAEESVNAGAAIINDISGGEMDKSMIKTVAKLKVPFVCMHIKGVPETMQNHANYEDLKKEILDFFIDKINECKNAGINDIIIDPGFGFGKNISQNLHLLKHLRLFKILEKPIMIGVSRKSTIYKTLKITAEESLNGTTVLNTIGLLNGASILRVHDVKEAMQAVTLVQSCNNA
ncbi:MAG: dihydropteroate synthase [Ginsengibacter sp.]